MKRSMHSALTWLVFGAVAFGTFWAGVAWASQQQLDEANASVTKAVQSLKSVESDAKAAPYAGHVTKAVRLLMRAQGEILKAKKQAGELPQK